MSIISLVPNATDHRVGIGGDALRLPAELRQSRGRDDMLPPFRPAPRGATQFLLRCAACELIGLRGVERAGETSFPQTPCARVGFSREEMVREA